MNKNSEIYKGWKEWKNFTENEMNNYKDQVFKYYRKKGYPKRTINEYQKELEFNKLKEFDTDIVLEEDNVLITCDSFGSHYSTNNVFNDLVKIKNIIWMLLNTIMIVFLDLLKVMCFKH